MASHARVDDHFNRASVRRCDIPGWPECVGFVMKSPTESDRIIARRIAKALVEELKATLSGGGLKQEECSQRISEAIQRESRKTGISQLLLKSNMMRIQDNRL